MGRTGLVSGLLDRARRSDEAATDGATAVGELEGMVYGGEDLVGTTAVGSAHVAVTSHRVLVLSPEGEGPRFRAVARPNVLGVGVGSEGSEAAARRALRTTAYSLALLGAGSFIDLGGTIGSVETPEGTGIGGIIRMAVAVSGILGVVDDVLSAAGFVFALVALFFGARYLRSRSRYVEIEVAGDDPVRIPIAREERDVAGKLDAALDDRPYETA